MRRIAVIVIVLAVVVAAFAIAWIGTGWPEICLSRGWCDPAGPLARLAHAGPVPQTAPQAAPAAKP